MHGTVNSSDRVTFSWLLWSVVVIVLIALNAITQPFEDAVSLVQPSKPYYLDVVWYLDDIIGPSFFMMAGILLLSQCRMRKRDWAVAGFGLSCIAFALGDTMDIHWVMPTGLSAGEQAVSFSSWMSKVMVVITFCFFIVHSYDRLSRPAQKAAVFAFVLLYIDQIQMSISFDFAGYAFHVFEEILEVVTGLFFCFGTARRKVLDEETTVSGL